MTRSVNKMRLLHIMPNIMHLAGKGLALKTAILLWVVSRNGTRAILQPLMRIKDLWIVKGG